MTRHRDDAERSGSRARRILERLTGSTQPLDESLAGLDASQLAQRLEQIEQLFLLHGGERAASAGPAPESVLFDWGHLQVLERLGSGTFGEVYRAHDTTLQRDVALKLLKPDAGLALQSQLFLHEARQLARVRHRNVLVVHGAAVHGGRPGLWTDLIHGVTAHDDALRDSFFRRDAVLELVESLALAVQAVHAAGLVHGDIKPSNLMRDAEGNWVLMDFGASRVARGDALDPLLTSGTPLYMAPEVVLGKAPDERADLYSMGAALYRILVGAAPVDAGGLEELRSRHREGRRSAPAAACRRIDRRIGRLVDRLMSPQPAQRPGLDEVLAELRAIRLAPQRRFRRVALGSIAALLVGGLALTSFGFWRANEARLAAEREQRNTAAVNGFLQRVLATPSSTGRARDMTVEGMLRQAAEDLAPMLRDQPAAQVVVHRVLADSFNTLRLPELAEQQVALARGQLATLDAPMPAIERNLDLEAMRAAEHREQHEEAIAMARRFVDRHLATLGDEHTHIRWARKFMVTNALSLSRYHEAEALMDAHFREVPDPETADSHFGYEILQSRANLHRVQGRFAEAVVAAEQALDWLRRYPLARPNNEVAALTNLALNLAAAGRPGRAIEVIKQLLPLQERIYGKASGEHVGGLINLAALQREAGQVEASGETLEGARALVEANPEAVPVEQKLGILMNLANVLNATGDQQRGEAMIREALVGATAHWGPSHLNVLSLEYNLAELMHQQGRYAEARDLAAATLERKADAFGEDHVLTLLTMDNLAVALAGLGRGEEAVALHDRACERLAAQLGPDHPYTLLAERNRLASLQRLGQAGDHAEAIEALVARHEQALGPEHPDTIKARALLAR